LGVFPDSPEKGEGGEISFCLVFGETLGGGNTSDPTWGGAGGRKGKKSSAVFLVWGESHPSFKVKRPRTPVEGGKKKKRVSLFSGEVPLYMEKKGLSRKKSEWKNPANERGRKVKPGEKQKKRSKRVLRGWFVSPPPVGGGGGISGKKNTPFCAC